MVRTRRVLLSSAGLLAGALLGTVTITACGDPFPGTFTPPTAPVVLPYGGQYSTDNPLVPAPTSPLTPPTTTPFEPIPKTTGTRATIQVASTTAPTPRTTAPATAPATTPACGAGYVRDASGHCVLMTPQPPDGAVARCADGTYSVSRHRRNACDGHGGVVAWL
jgi:hypothetical protein